MTRMVYKLVALVLLIAVCLTTTIPAHGDALDDLFSLLTRSIDVLQSMVFKFQTSQAVDYLDPTTRNFFLRLIKHEHGGSYSIAQICDIYDYCYSHWTYVSDPDQHEYIASASDSIDNDLHGDCEDFAVLMAAGIKAIGGTSWIIVQRQGNDGHAFTQVYVASSDEYLQTYIRPYLYDRYDLKPGNLWGTDLLEKGLGVWLNLDYTGPRPGSPFLFQHATVVNLIPFWGTGPEPSLQVPE